MPAKIALISASLALLVGFSFFYMFYMNYMWQKALVYSKDGSKSLGVFIETSTWLMENLKENETALIPISDVFHVAVPELKNRLIEYSSLWSSAGIALTANTTEDEILEVRSYLINFLKENPQVKYVIRDWVDPYAKHLFEVSVNDELPMLIREIKEFTFILSTGWSNKITIYEQAQYAPFYAINFSFAHAQFFVLPEDVPFKQDSSGLTIQKGDSKVGIYLPLDEEIGSSKQGFVTMKIQLSLEPSGGILIFYCDKNRDGKFSGYESDYVLSVALTQIQHNGVVDEWQTIHEVVPKVDDPIVQISMIILGEGSGSLTLSDLTIYLEITS